MHTANIFSHAKRISDFLQCKVAGRGLLVECFNIKKDEHVYVMIIVGCLQHVGLQQSCPSKEEITD